MLPLTGYAERLSARPGQTLRFHVANATGTSVGASVVRVRCADPNPAIGGITTDPVPIPVDTLAEPGPQPVPLGSYAVLGPVGLLRDITTVVTEDKVNMVGVRTIENGDGSVTIQATLETTGIEQLSRLLSRLEIIRGVRAVDRVQEKKRKGGQAEPIPIRRAANQS